jgi:hypothetical protein
VEKVGLITLLLPFIEQIPRVSEWLHDKPILEKYKWFLWVIGGVCVIWGVCKAYRKKFNEAKELNEILATRRNREGTKTKIMEFVQEGERLAHAAPNGLASDEDMQGWLNAVQGWRDNATAFLGANCSESATQKFNTLGSLMRGFYEGKHPKGHDTITTLNRLTENLVQIVEQENVYLTK